MGMCQTIDKSIGLFLKIKIFLMFMVFKHASF